MYYFIHFFVGDCLFLEYRQTMTEYIPYSPSRAASLAYQTKTPPKYVDHRDAIYNTTLSPY